MLLTEQEIDDLSREMVKGYKSVNWLAQKIESAVLERLKAQEPVAWMNSKRDMTFTHGPYNADDLPLYEHPLPPDDVVRDAERYRWLRNSGKGDNLIKYDCRGVYLPESSALDRAIDSAMEKA